MDHLLSRPRLQRVGRGCVGVVCGEREAALRKRKNGVRLISRNATQGDRRDTSRSHEGGVAAHTGDHDSLRSGGAGRSAPVRPCARGEAPPQRSSHAASANAACSSAASDTPATRQAAGELAEDCRRYQAGEPIAARPIGAVARVWKRAKRHKAVAIPVAALAVLGICWEDTADYCRG